MSETAPLTDTETKAPTQAELYDDLRRIGELEDKKQEIQSEIDEKTKKLQDAVGELDSASLLYKMLKSVLQPAKPAARKTTPRKTSRKRS